MDNGNTNNPYVAQHNRGPSVAGTRITLYAILDELHHGTPEYVQNLYSLSDEVWAGVMRYIEEHRDELERRLEEILQRIERDRIYWTERNKHRFDLPPSPPANEKIALGRAKLAAIKAELARQPNGACKSS